MLIMKHILDHPRFVCGFLEIYTILVLSHPVRWQVQKIIVIVLSSFYLYISEIDDVMNFIITSASVLVKVTGYKLPYCHMMKKDTRLK